jgi:hypothetical protein
MPSTETTGASDFAGNNIAQKKRIENFLRSAFETPHPESGATAQGWPCVAQLVMYWLKHPSEVPQPPENPLRGLVFIEDDGMVRLPTSRDM